jgi:hypothetical protein
VKSSPSSAIEHIKAIKFDSSIKNFKGQDNIDDEKDRPCSGEEWIIDQALIELKSVGFWVCYVLLAGLSGDAKAYLEMRKSTTGMFSNSSVIKLDMSISEAVMDRGVVLKEVKELKEAADCIAAATANEKESYRAEEMQRRLKAFEQLLDGLDKEVNSLFSKILAGRNELLDGIRHTKQ